MAGTPYAGKDAYLTFALLEIAGPASGYASEVTAPFSAAEIESGVIGRNWTDYIQGQASHTISASGAWDAGTGAAAIDAVLFGALNAGGTKLFEFMPQGSAASRILYKGNALCTGYELSAPVAGRVGFSLALRGAGSVTRSITVA